MLQQIKYEWESSIRQSMLDVCWAYFRIYQREHSNFLMYSGAFYLHVWQTFYWKLPETIYVFLLWLPCVLWNGYSARLLCKVSRSMRELYSSISEFSDSQTYLEWALMRDNLTKQNVGVVSVLKHRLFIITLELFLMEPLYKWILTLVNFNERALCVNVNCELLTET